MGWEVGLSPYLYVEGAVVGILMDVCAFPFILLASPPPARLLGGVKMEQLCCFVLLSSLSFVTVGAQHPRVQQLESSFMCSFPSLCV